MKTLSTICATCMLLALPFLLSTLAAAQDCSQILGSIREKSEQNGSVIRESTYYRAFCDSIHSSYGEAQQYGLRVGIPIEGLPVDFDGSSRTDNWADYQRKICDTISTGSKFSSTWHNSFETVNKNAIAAWERCIASSGLHFWAEVNQDEPKKLVIRAHWIPAGRPYHTTAKGPLTGDHLQCTGDEVKKGTRIDSAGLALSCQRDGNNSITVLLRTENGNPSFTIPPAPAPACLVYKKQEWFHSRSEKYPIIDDKVQIYWTDLQPGSSGKPRVIIYVSRPGSSVPDRHVVEEKGFFEFKYGGNCPYRIYRITFVASDLLNDDIALRVESE